MIKVVMPNGEVRHYNVNSIEYYMPAEGKIVLCDGRVFPIDKELSDTDLLEARDESFNADLYYMRQFLVNLSCLTMGRTPAVLIQDGVSDIVLSLTGKVWKDITEALKKKE